MVANPLFVLTARQRAQLRRTLRFERGVQLASRALNLPNVHKAASLVHGERRSILFATSLLRAREIKMATALRQLGWKVILIYVQTTPFHPERHFDVAIRARTGADAHAYAKAIAPRLCHVFSGAVDDLLVRFCREQPAPVIIDLNDVFCPALFNYCEERFEPTRECLERAVGLCARDVQAKRAERIDSFKLPPHKLLFPEYSWRDGPRAAGASKKGDPAEVRVVSVGTFCLETLNMTDSGYLAIARMFAEQRIHLHIYPHWFYRRSRRSSFNWDPKRDFADFLRLEADTGYVHVHESLPLEDLARALPQYDFGLIAGGSTALGQKLRILKPAYMESCYSGRISDYLDARLPVLINHEVGFNYRLLHRLGVAVDLAGVLQPGFREQLQSLKHDPLQAARVEEAAEHMSLERNIPRLAAFYEEIMAEDQRYRVRLEYPWSLARSLPLVGAPFRQLESSLHKHNQTALGLQTALNEETAEARHRQRVLEVQHDLLESLQSRLDQTVQDLRAETEREQQLKAELAARTTASDSSRRGILYARRRLEVERGSRWADEIAGLLNWPEIRDPIEQVNGMPELLDMIRLFGEGSRTFNEISSCWQVLGFKNFNQLLRDGYRNFKRTIGFNYFNFLVQEGDPQIAFLEATLGRWECQRLKAAAQALPDDPDFEWHDQAAYRYFVLMLWSYAKSIDVNHHLDRLAEPAEGNPIIVRHGEQRASQDLANSVLEYYSMAGGVDFKACRRVLEIGGGYGRDAFVILSLNPHIQYTLVDIPPALWLAQRYLSSVFDKRAVFRVRGFARYEDVREEMSRASIVCLLPHQLELLPDAHFHLSLNISSFGEMQPKQIKSYLDVLERVTEGHFYSKQWKVSQNAFDNLSLTEDDYPVSRAWARLYSRTCAVQTGFFEALYRATKPTS
jgi:putative sugar O-methyltransferase